MRALRARLEPAPVPGLQPGPTRVVAIALAIVAVAVGVGVFFMARAPARPRAALTVPKPRTASPRAPKKAAPTYTPTRAAGCACTGENGKSAWLDYYSSGMMSLGRSQTHYATFGLGVLEGTKEKHFDHLATDVETAPPDQLPGGNVDLVVGCLDDRIVFAYGQRVTAWSFETGRPLWNATLPAPVGQTKNGSLHVTCSREKAKVKDGKVTIATAAGNLVLDGKDGSRLEK